MRAQLGTQGQWRGRLSDFWASESRPDFRPLPFSTHVDVPNRDELGALGRTSRRLRQVVFNWLSNAVKFTPEGGRVVVASARVDGEVLVTLTDTGPGISPARTTSGYSRSSSRRA
jgi:signal transduction histidine kinase